MIKTRSSALLPTLMAVACLLAGPVLAQSEPQARARAERFLDQVVRILPRIEGAPATDTGFGILVGERDGRLFVAVPHHVAFGRQNAARTPDDAPRVAFRGDPFTHHTARRLPVGSIPDDLAVLEVPIPRGFQAPRIARAASGTVPRGTWAWNIGIGGDWDMPDRAGGVGPIDAVSRWMRVGSLRTPPGASGGAVVTEDALLGMVLEDGNNFSLILPADRIVELFVAWRLPVNLLAGSAADRTDQTVVAAAPPAETGVAAAQSPRHQSLLTQTLSATARGTCPDIMGTELRVQCQNQMPMMGQLLARKGRITSATFVGIQDTPTGPAETYRVNFAQGAMVWFIATSPDGKIQILWSPG
jgi:hypothetical protein